MTVDYYAKQNDTGSVITGIAVDAAGVVSIAAADIRFVMAPIEGGEPKVDAPAANGEDNEEGEGVWSYEFADEDLDTPGYYLAEVEVTFEDGSVKTFPNDGYLSIRITPELGTLES